MNNQGIIMPYQLTSNISFVLQP